MRHQHRFTRLAFIALIGAGGIALLISSGHFFRWKPVSVIYNDDKTQQPALRMQIYPARTEGSNHPAVLFFHGGGWITGSPDQFKWFAKRFAACGIVAALVEYRVHSRHGTLPDRAVDDASTAYRWMQRNHARFGVNPAHIALVGGSAGAHVAAASTLSCAGSNDCTGQDTKPPFALGLLNPVLELTVANESQGYTKEELLLIDALGPSKAAELSLGSKLARADIPKLVIYGSLDPLLPTAYQAVSSQVEGSRDSIQLLIAAGEKHGFFNNEPWRTIVGNALMEFFHSQGANLDCELETNDATRLQKASDPGA